jgi:hypothetical protein
MNRTQRRRAASVIPAPYRKSVLRGNTPEVDMTPEQVDRYGLSKVVRHGSIVIVPGHRLNATRDGLEQCPKGQETPLRVNIVPGGERGTVDKAQAG